MRPAEGTTIQVDRIHQDFCQNTAMPRLEMTGPLPAGLPHPRRNDPCPCGHGRIFKKCCGSSSSPHLVARERRLLVVGAGATVEECRQSGNEPGRPFPTMRDFANQLFNESAPLQRVIATYLDTNGIGFDDTIIRAYESGGGTVSSVQMEESPMRVFQRLEAADHSVHNVERLLEHVWLVHGNDGELWEVLAWDGVFMYLVNAFITQFGLGPASEIRPLHAGQTVARRLGPGDRVISLNYDTAFDLALQQARRYFTYAPEYRRGAITVHKPHGSFNLYANQATGDAFFADPSRQRGSVALRDAQGQVWSPAAAIVPPRLSKSYAQHPHAARILSGLAAFRPNVVTFWGVGLTPSDSDLLDVYRTASAVATRIEFINPDSVAAGQAQRVLGRTLSHYERLADWLAAAPSVTS